MRPLEITYVDTESRQQAPTHAAFLIEPENVLAKRRGAKAAEVVSIQPADLEPVQANLIEIFEFMIGNTDFSMLQGPKATVLPQHRVARAAYRGAARGAV